MQIYFLKYVFKIFYHVALAGSEQHYTILIICENSSPRHRIQALGQNFSYTYMYGFLGLTRGQFKGHFFGAIGVISQEGLIYVVWV